MYCQYIYVYIVYIVLLVYISICMYMLVYYVYNRLTGQNWDSTKCTYNSYMLVFNLYIICMILYCLYTFVYECKFVRFFIVRVQCIYLQNLYIGSYTNESNIEIHMYIECYTNNIQTYTNNIRLSHVFS